MMEKLGKKSCGFLEVLMGLVLQDIYSSKIFKKDPVHSVKD